MDKTSAGQKQVVSQIAQKKELRDQVDKTRKLDLSDTVFHKMKIEVDTKEHNVKERSTLERMYDDDQQIDDGIKIKEKEISEVCKYN